MTATKLWVSETADDGVSPTFNLVGDEHSLARIWVATSGGTKLVANVTGPAVDLGNYREIPIAVVEVVGPAPANNDPVTVTAVVSLI